MDNLYVPSVEITATGSHICSSGEGGSISVTRRFWSTRIKKFAVLLKSWQPPTKSYSLRNPSWCTWVHSPWN